MKKINSDEIWIRNAVILICLCFLAGSLTFVFSMMKQSERQAMHSLLNAGSRLQSTFQKQIQGDLETLEAISIVIGETGEKDPEVILELLKKVNDRNRFIRMGYADLSGQAEVVDINSDHHYSVGLSTGDFFRETLETGSGLSQTHLSETGMSSMSSATRL